MTTKTLMLEAPIDLCVDGSGLSRFLDENDCRIIDPAQAVPDVAVRRIIDLAIEKARALHGYAGRPAWEETLADAIREVLSAPSPAADERKAKDPGGFLKCTHPDCGRYWTESCGGRWECRAMADNACARKLQIAPSPAAVGGDLNLTDQQIFNFAALHDCEAGSNENLLAFARAVEFTAQTRAARAAFNKWGQPASTPAGVPDEWRNVMSELVIHIEQNTCFHDETERLGFIWERCRQCGSQWADDEGGVPRVEYPDYVQQARELLAAASPAPDEYEEVGEQYLVCTPSGYEFWAPIPNMSGYAATRTIYAKREKGEGHE